MAVPGTSGLRGRGVWACAAAIAAASRVARHTVNTSRKGRKRGIARQFRRVGRANVGPLAAPKTWLNL